VCGGKARGADSPTACLVVRVDRGIEASAAAVEADPFVHACDGGGLPAVTADGTSDALVGVHAVRVRCGGGAVCALGDTGQKREERRVAVPEISWGASPEGPGIARDRGRRRGRAKRPSTWTPRMVVLTDRDRQVPPGSEPGSLHAQCCP